jgi:deoxyribodipyrimidine photolyase-related protein
MASDTPRFVTPDQLGPHFDDGGPIVLVNNRGALTKRPIHRQKAHLILSALYHREKELGSRGRLIHADSYQEALQGLDLEVINPPSFGLRRRVEELSKSATIQVLPARGFVISEDDFVSFAEQTKKSAWKMETFYRHIRHTTGLLMDQGSGDIEPVGGRYNFDEDNRLPPPKNHDTLGVPEAWWPVEDEIDQKVRAELDELERSGQATFMGVDGPRVFAVTRQEALDALNHFITYRLDQFGPYEDAAMVGDWAMSHSLLSVPLNLGLLDPLEVARAAEDAYRRGEARLSSVEGFIRQVVGWREWVWQLYWWLGEDYVESSNYFGHTNPLPDAFRQLDPDQVSSNCLKTVIGEVRDRGWSHHINRLMVLGNFALERGINPALLNQWFIDAFVDGTPWVMPANVVGMSQHADGGKVATKPYLSGGAYLNTMTNYCSGCPFSPTVRLGDKACPFTAGYWAFLDRHADLLRSNYRMSKPLAGRARLADLDEVVFQEAHRTLF